MKTRLVIYHGDCSDGFCAAWVAWRKWGEVDTEYVAAQYGDAPPEVSGRHVWILDFSYPRAVLIDMASKAKSIRVLDHHKTARDELGAAMAYDELSPPDEERDRLIGRRWLVDYVQDRDLWAWRLNGSREVNAYIAIVPKTFEAYDKLAALGPASAAQIGRGLAEAADAYVESMRPHARTMQCAGYLVPVVNAPPAHISELLGALAEGRAFAVGWWIRGDGQVVYSLRSRGEWAIDVSEVAKRFGGGGHRNAAGFTLSLAPIDEMPKPTRAIP